MTITPSLFEAFLKCPTKCWLRATSETPSGNTYAGWVQSQNESFRATETERLLAETPPGESARSPAPENLKTGKWRLAVDVVGRAAGVPRSSRRQEAPSFLPQPATLNTQPTTQSLVTSAATEQAGEPPATFTVETRLHGVERVPSEGRGKAAQFIPIRFVFFNKLGKDDRLLVAFDAFVLSATLGREATAGRIIHGDDHATLKVKTSSLAGEVRKRLEKLAALLSSPTPPDLILNRHCGECEFQTRCRQQAVEKDDLSLLSRMSAKERKKLHNKGIFTVTQLSYTFRARRRCKRWKSQRPGYSPALKALAVREKKVHVIGRPKIELVGTPVYLDVEGTDDDFFYLIGCRADAQYHSFWAEGEAHERMALQGFLEFLSSVPSPKLIYYGHYEHRFLRVMRQRYSDLFERFPSTTNLQQESLNLISVMYARIYFPAYGNSLKDLAKHLGFAWTSGEASGLQALVWRAEWESTGEDRLKGALLRYNAEDCEALELVTHFVTKLCKEDGLFPPAPDCVRVQELKTASPFLINKGGGALPEFKAINQSAYWDYQRLRVYVRTSKLIKKASRPHKVGIKPHVVREAILVHPPPRRCPSCSGTLLLPRPGASHSIVHDIKFLPHGAKAWVTRNTTPQRYCPRCKRVVEPPADHPFSRCKYGPILRALAVDQLIRLNVPGATIARSLGDLFHYELTGEHLSQFKEDFAELYGDAVTELTARITNGYLVHADETAARVVGKSVVVWVLASMEEVVFLYAESREGKMVHKIMSGFRGVLVSDFYAVYDGYDCPQQKCLIHLIRDFNDDLHRYPFDSELRQIASEFTSVLKPIVETIDQRGLKARFLAKHQSSVRRFLTWATSQEFESETAQKYGQRFRKNQKKLFTFMDYDGVPWNNNNAENAIRAFASLRERIGGHCTEKSLRHYLMLLSLSETCKRRGLSFFDFLCSGKTSLEAFVADPTSSRRTIRRKSSTVGGNENAHEQTSDEQTTQRTSGVTRQNEPLPVVAVHVPSPWDRFRPPTPAALSARSGRPLELGRFDHAPLGGVVLALPALMESGIFEQSSDLFPAWIDRPFTETALLFIASMLLSPRGNVEATECAWPTGWSEVLCRARLPDTCSLVDLISLIGQNAGAVAMWQAALAVKWISDTSRASAVLVDRGQARVLLEDPVVSSGKDRARDLLLACGKVEQWFRVMDGAPMLLLRQFPSDEVLRAWKEWILPQIRGLLPGHVEKRGITAAAKPCAPTVVLGAGGLDLRLIRKLQRDGLHFLTYRLSSDGLWPGGELAEQEVELWPGHRESMRTAEREVSMTCGPPLREVLCVLRNKLELTVISSNHKLDLRRVAAKVAFEFSATRFLDRLEMSLALLRSSKAQSSASGAAEMEGGTAITDLVSGAVLVVLRTEAIMEQLLREKLPRPMESRSALQDILGERIDLVPLRGANILKVLVHTKGDVGEQARVAHLCSQLTTTETLLPGTNLRLVYVPVPHDCIRTI